MTAARPPGNCGNYADWFRSPSPDVKGWLSPVAALAIAAVLDTQESNGIGGSLAGALPEFGLTVAATKNALAVGDGDPMEQLREMIIAAVRDERLSRG